MRPVAAITLLTATALAFQDQNDIQCVRGLYLVVARGTAEQKGTGACGDIADRVASRIPDSKVVGLDYPASGLFPVYADSEASGVVVLKKLLEDFVKKCHDGKFALIGYSQGGQVAEDVLCGTPNGLFQEIDRLDENIIREKMVAAIFFGDPTHVKESNFTLGTSSTDGIFYRDEESLHLCESLSANDTIRSYCDKGDPFCDRNARPTNMDVHLGYFKAYGDNVVDYLTEKFHNVTGKTVDGVSQDDGPSTNNNLSDDDKHAENDDHNEEGDKSKDSSGITMKTVGGLLYYSVPLALLAIL